MAKILGCLTLAGLLVIGVAIGARSNDVAYPVPITLLCLGAACSLMAGIPWAHTRGMGRWKAAFLGVVGFAGGGAGGVFLGEALDPGGERNLGVAILLLIGGFWFGAILLGGLGVWWGIRFHRRDAAEVLGQKGGE